MADTFRRARLNERHEEQVYSLLTSMLKSAGRGGLGFEIDDALYALSSGLLLLLHPELPADLTKEEITALCQEWDIEEPELLTKAEAAYLRQTMPVRQLPARMLAAQKSKGQVEPLAGRTAQQPSSALLDWRREQAELPHSQPAERSSHEKYLDDRFDQKYAFGRLKRQLANQGPKLFHAAPALLSRVSSVVNSGGAGLSVDALKQLSEQIDDAIADAPMRRMLGL